MITILTAVTVVLLVLGAGAYLYFAYAPVPAMPLLSSVIQPGNINIGNHNRTYQAYIPKKLSPAPGMIIALHGTGMDAARMRQWSGFELEKLADEYGFIVVYPNGYKGNWNDCRKDAPFPAKKENIDDVGFIEKLIARFIEEHHIDAKKVYAFGFSNGGQMALRLAIERPELIRAVCAIGANMPTAATCSCTLEGRTSEVLLIAGTKDPINPYRGGVVSLFGLKKIGTAMSAIATAKSFAHRNHVMDEPVNSKISGTNDGTTIERLSYIAAGKPMVELWTVYGGGHVIPQTAFRFPRIMGKTTRNLDAPLAAVRFFGFSR